MIQSNWIAVRAFPFLLVGVGFCFVERVQSEDGKSHRPSEDLQFSQGIVGAGAAKPALSVFEALELTKKYIEQEGIDVSEQHVSSVILKDGREQAASRPRAETAVEQQNWVLRQAVHM